MWWDSRKSTLWGLLVQQQISLYGCRDNWDAVELWMRWSYGTSQVGLDQTMSPNNAHRQWSRQCSHHSKHCISDKMCVIFRVIFEVLVYYFLGVCEMGYANYVCASGMLDSSPYMQGPSPSASLPRVNLEIIRCLQNAHWLYRGHLDVSRGPALGVTRI